MTLSNRKNMQMCSGYFFIASYFFPGTAGSFFTGKASFLLLHLTGKHPIIFVEASVTCNCSTTKEDTIGIQTFEKEVEHLGETHGMEDHDHDMIHDLSRRLGMLWRYDQYIANANANGNKKLQLFWKKLKTQEQQNIHELKALIKKHVDEGCF